MATRKLIRVSIRWLANAASEEDLVNWAIHEVLTRHNYLGDKGRGYYHKMSEETRAAHLRVSQRLRVILEKRQYAEERKQK